MIFNLDEEIKTNNVYTENASKKFNHQISNSNYLFSNYNQENLSNQDNQLNNNYRRNFDQNLNQPNFSLEIETNKFIPNPQMNISTIKSKLLFIYFFY